MSYKLEEETGNESHKRILREQIDSLKEHWKNVQQKSNDWRTRINLMWELWRQYEQLKNQLEAWLTKAEERMNKSERETGNTVAELEQLLENHKVRNARVFASPFFSLILCRFLPHLFFRSIFCSLPQFHLLTLIISHRRFNPLHISSPFSNINTSVRVVKIE